MRGLRKPFVLLGRTRRNERGAYAVLMSMTLVLVIALAAIAVDIASQVSSKQQLKDTMDAAAHAGAMSMDSGAAAALAAAREAAARNGYDGPLSGSAWCVVAAVTVGGINQPNSAQLPGTCNPGLGLPWTKSLYPGTVCSDALCFIPCDEVKGKCNTVRLEGERSVDYKFAPAIGYDQGSTGAVVSVACKGSCGTEAPNPMDIVVVADRTLSLSSGDRLAMKNAIKNMMRQMDPRMHYLALGTIHKSEPTTSCRTAAGSVGSSPTSTDMNKGVWVPTDFSRGYVVGEPGARTWVTSDAVFKAVDCLPSSDGDYGTHLAAPMKEAARKLLGFSASNLGSLTTNYPRDGLVKKVIIFETDGQPNEKRATTTSTSVSVAGDPRATDKATACTNLKKVATDAKNRGILIITIGFGEAATGLCVSGGETIRSVLASAASPTDSGEPSVATSCDTAAARVVENTDGDYFFCGDDGAEFDDIFRTAFSQLSEGIRLLKMPV